MAVAYLTTPIAIAGLVRFAPPSMSELTRSYILGLIVFGFPLMVLLGFGTADCGRRIAPAQSP